MKTTVVATSLAVVCYLSIPAVILAKGGGHGGGGGHSGGGHAGGGHSGGSHSSGGHSGGHSGSGSSGQSASGGRAAAPANGARSSADNHAIVGTAVPRPTSLPSPFRATLNTYAPGYFVPSYVTGFNNFGFGLSSRRLWPYGYSAYAFQPYSMYGYGGYGYGGYGYEGYDYPGYAAVSGYAGPPEASPDLESGNVRLDVQPQSAQIFVDGYFVGTVQDFHQTLAGLNLSAGAHHVEFSAAGYETLAIDMKITAGNTITYRASLQPQ
jgi:hypothetical protein